KAAMLAADLIVVPTTPGAADAWALQNTLDVLADVRALRPEIRAAVVLNRVDRTRLTKSVRDALAGFGLPTLGVELAARVTYGKATLSGQGVVDYAPGSPAAREMEQLTAAVLAALRDEHGEDPPGTKPRQETTEAPSGGAPADGRPRREGARPRPRRRTV